MLTPLSFIIHSGYLMDWCYNYSTISYWCSLYLRCVCVCVGQRHWPGSPVSSFHLENRMAARKDTLKPELVQRSTLYSSSKVLEEYLPGPAEGRNSTQCGPVLNKRAETSTCPQSLINCSSLTWQISLMERVDVVQELLSWRSNSITR